MAIAKEISKNENGLTDNIFNMNINYYNQNLDEEGKIEENE